MTTSIRCALRSFCAFAVVVLIAACSASATDSQYHADARAPVEGEARFYHFDVGQADATLVWGPDGTILIDAGHWQENDVVPYLQELGVTEIDLFILTHPHADHIGQVSHVLREFEVTEVWMTGWEHETQTFERTLDAVHTSRAGYREPRAGETQALGELVVEVLNPSEPLEDIHDNLAVRVRFGDFAAVYTGDAEVEHELMMIDRHDEIRAQVLQLGHHGSRTSSSREFLTAVDPEVAIYSAAQDSQYNHPHDTVIARINALNIPVYGTAGSGTITVTTDGTDFELAEQRDGAAQRAARAAAIESRGDDGAESRGDEGGEHSKKPSSIDCEEGLACIR